MAGNFGKPNATGRSSGKLTGRDAKLMRPPDGEPFVWLTRDLLASEAWKGLSVNGRRLMDFLLIEHMNHAGTENGNLQATYEQLVQFGFSRRKISSAIEEAEKLGLIRCQRGGKRRPSTYRLTFYTSRDRSPPTNEWKNYTRKINSSVPPGGTKQVPPGGTITARFNATMGHQTSVPPGGTPSISSPALRDEKATKPPPQTAGGQKKPARPGKALEEVTWPETGYRLTGPELAALCEASGHSVRSFARLIGIDGRMLRRKCPVGYSEDAFATSAIDQMREEAAETT